MCPEVSLLEKDACASRSNSGTGMIDHADLLKALVARRSLSSEQMSDAIGAIMDARFSPVQAAAFLALLAAKGESPDEVLGAARAMRARSLRVDHRLTQVLDVCGTGGDGVGTINISTIVAFVVASCGLAVAKHGNRAASSRCGTADVLEALGIPIDLEPEAARRELESKGFVFLFAQRYHPAMRNIAPIRRDLGVRTIFNLLGPLTNPARATHQVVGVSDERHLDLIAHALEGLGGLAGAVVHATSGLDEIAGDVPTQVVRFRGGRRERMLIDPADYGISVPQSEIIGGDVGTNARALEEILSGERSSRSDLIALNAALPLLIAERVGSIGEGIELARRQLHEGAAHAVFEAARRRP